MEDLTSLCRPQGFRDEDPEHVRLAAQENDPMDGANTSATQRFLDAAGRHSFNSWRQRVYGYDNDYWTKRLQLPDRQGSGVEHNEAIHSQETA